MRTRTHLLVYTFLSSLILAGVSPAIGGARGVLGASSEHNSAKTSFTIRDTESDGDNAYGNWAGTSNNRIQTTGGNGSSKTVTGVSVGNHRGCRDVFGFDPCSSFGP